MVAEDSWSYSHKNSPLDPVLSQLNPVHTPTLTFFGVHFTKNTIKINVSPLGQIGEVDFLINISYGLYLSFNTNELV
jgi:hypothetical protein